MPNWCNNRVNLSDNGNTEQFDRLVKILDGPNPFNEIFPMPDFKTIPNAKGELPVKEVHKNDKGEIVCETYNFPDGKNDDRWYHWCIQNWGTKWDAYSLEIDDTDLPHGFEVTFETAWSPPEEVCHAIREQYDDLSISWFYDEPGCEVAGYL